MPSCEMCGAEGKLFRALIEGAQLNVCKKCASFGKIVEAPRIVVNREGKEGAKPKQLISQRQIVQLVVPNYGRIIKEKREKLGLTQEDFAKKINERESLIQKVENEKIELNINLARKLESFLKVKLIEQVEDEGGHESGKESGVVTIGDVIKIKSRK